MGSRERDSKSLQDKLKELFNAKKSGARGELNLSLVAGELGAPTPLPRRLRAIRDLTDKLATHRLPAGGDERVWWLVRDLVEEQSGAGWTGQAAALPLLEALRPAPALRCALLRYLMESTDAPHAAAPPAAAARLALLQRVVSGGRSLTGAEEQVGPLLARWLSVAPPPPLGALLALATAVVKYNASALREHVLADMVHATCSLMCRAPAPELPGALALLEAVVAYAVLPRGALPGLVGALCRAANVESGTQPCWRLMRLVCGADLGHAALHAALQLCDAAGAGGDAAGAARGAVLLVHHSLWGPQRAPSLRCSPLSVLPALRRACCARVPAVTLEVVSALQALLAVSGRELDAPGWSALLAVLLTALQHALELQDEGLRARVHAALTAVEQLHVAGHYNGDLDELLDLLDVAAPQRPEASVMWSITLRASSLCGASGAADALTLADRHIRRETRLTVRLHALDAVMGYCTRHHLLHGDELLERVAVPVLAACVTDATAPPPLRAAAARHVPALARYGAVPVLTDLIDLLEKILNRPFEAYGGDAAMPPDDDAGELALAAGALQDVIHARLLASPAAPVARALLVLLDHVEQHYRRPWLLQRASPTARTIALDVVMQLRADASHAVACTPLGDWRARPVYSALLLAEPRRDLPAGAALVPAGRVARALHLALDRERDWGVLSGVLRALPQLVGVRALCVGRRAGELDALAAALCALCGERGARGAPSVSELHAAVLPALGALAPLHGQLDGASKQRVVRCLLQHGLALRAGAGALAALGVWALEARDTMLRLLPEVLLDLSKLSDTLVIAAPMLELLSTLARLPRVFASLAEDQYMSVFAVVLPYTNPSRYNHYVVSLAHHVIAAWFLKCRLVYRRNFVRFIIHGLHNYIIMPFEEQLQRGGGGGGAGGGGGTAGTVGAAEGVNEDSSLRQRSSSLGSRRPPARAPLAAASAALHMELTECCVELLARHCHAPVSAVAARAPPAHALFAGGPSMTWLVGHRLVTVTTSGCTHSALKAGPCDRCRATLSQHHSTQHGEGESEEYAEDTHSEVAAALEYFRPRLGSMPLDPEVCEADAAETGGAGAGGAAAACWGAQWAEIRVRAPTGDTAFTLRVQNRLGWEGAGDAPLHELAALLAAPPAPSALAEVVTTVPPSPPHQTQPNEIHKSSSDGGVVSSAGGAGGGETGSARTSTRPINIPGSPQRQTAPRSDTDALVSHAQGKSRHPVRRSNSSPEMSSSWKLTARDLVEPDASSADLDTDPDDLILLPSTETQSASQQLLQTKKAAKKSCDTRVSCEAIPEEMSGTSPLAAPAAPSTTAAPAPTQHPHLMTHNSDPGECSPQHTAGAATHAPPVRRADAHDRDDLPPLARSKRSNTISVMSPTRRPVTAAPRSAPAPLPAQHSAGGSGGGGGGGVTPAFVFLSLYHNLSTYPLAPTLESGSGSSARTPLSERPLRVSGAQHERSLSTLDLVPPVETVRVGVVYVGPGQAADEVAALRNERGSARYGVFAAGLGAREPLPARRALFVALEAGRDGRYATVWADGALQVLFHVATDMPNHPHDPNANEKRKHIGNDIVSIVYNNSGEDFNIHTLKGQLNLCIVVVEPSLECADGAGMCRVSVRSKDERVRSVFLPHLEPLVVTDHCAPLLARQWALHAALAAQVSQSLSLGGAPFASNALERLRLIKRLRRRLEGERQALAATSPRPYAAAAANAGANAMRVAIDDFNDYT